MKLNKFSDMDPLKVLVIDRKYTMDDIEFIIKDNFFEYSFTQGNIEDFHNGLRKLPEILDRLYLFGLKEPYFELYDDFSGALVLGNQDEVNHSQLQIAMNEVFSERLDLFDQFNITILFCGALAKIGKKYKNDRKN